jgi:hypothetical protein
VESRARGTPWATLEGFRFMETYNIYMDETPVSGFDDEAFEVEFRVVPSSRDDSDQQEAVVAGLDLVDLINLRDALQQEIDNYALQALEAQAEALEAADDEE